MRLKLVAAACVASAFACATPASAYTIDDARTGSGSYWGADHHGYGDVIGDANLFDILGADINKTGSLVTVDVYTNFAGRADNGLFANYTAGHTGIGYGDLFLNPTWDPFGTPSHYAEDSHFNGTEWGYVFVLDNRFSDAGGSGTFYAINYAVADPVLLSDQFITGATFRNGQEVSVNTQSNALTNLGTGTWTVDAANRRLSFSVDIGAAAALLYSETLAMHWALTCGNDTIEGVASVPVPEQPTPEPGSLGLMSLGLAGAGLIRRRRSAA
jgi:hypothetical protein